MKTNLGLSLLFSLFTTSLFSQSNIQQSLSVNSTGAAADASAQLDVSATDKGMLVPRMTTAQRTAIGTPATGLLVYDSNTAGFWFYNGAAWQGICSGMAGTPSLLEDADGNTKVQVEKNPNEDIIRFDLGGTENLALIKNTAGMPRLEFSNALSNTFLGKDTGKANTTGDFNTATGRSALFTNTTGGNNTALGFAALYSNTFGDFNTANGGLALYSNTYGHSNTAVGFEALVSNAVGNGNTAIGRKALYANSGGGNTAIGFEALSANVAGTGNTATGQEALHANTVGYNNTASGRRSMYLNSNGVGNSAYGLFSLYANTTGSDNTAVGNSALSNNTTGSNNIAIGAGADVNPNTPNLYNTISIGNGGILNAFQNQAFIGNLSTAWIGGNVTWSTYSDARIKNTVLEDVKGLDFILRLRPVTYHISSKATTEITGNEETPDFPGKYDVEKVRYSGFIAQEVEQAAKDTGYDFSGYSAPQNQWGLYTISYAQFVVPLVKAVQEQQEEIGNFKSEIEKLRGVQTENTSLKSQLSSQAAQLDKITAALAGAGIALEK